MISLSFFILHFTDETIHTSEYVYLPKGSDKLCHTSNFQWRRDVIVYMVIAGETEREREKFRINISTFLFSEKSSWMDETSYTKLRGGKS